jgi:arginine/lysine/ornithine decarboxylase
MSINVFTPDGKLDDLDSANEPDFWVFHIEDEEDEREAIQDLLPDLQDAFRDALNETVKFATNSTSDASLGLIQAETAQEMFETEKFREPAESAVLLLLDYYMDEDKETTVFKERVDGVSTHELISAHFPETLKIVFTVGGEDEVREAEYDYLSKKILIRSGMEEIEFIKRIRRKWKSRFEPPFWKELYQYGQEGRESWHTPGHNFGSAFRRMKSLRDFHEAYGPTIFSTDQSVSVPSLGDLSETGHDSPLTQAQRRSSEVFGAEDTYYITNGTSTSNRVMLRALLKPDDVVIVDRNCHKSVHQAIAMAGALPLYLPPRFNNELGIWKPNKLSTIRSFIDAAGTSDVLNPRALILTTCTYEGALYPIREIAHSCEMNGMLFYADEAWAPYLYFHPEYRREDKYGDVRSYSAVEGGAHFAAQSTHKALAAFSQASMIHVSKRFREILEDEKNTEEWTWLGERFGVNGRGDYDKFRHVMNEELRYSHSTSPFYPILASLDAATTHMSLEGRQALGERIRWAKNLSENVGSDYTVGLEGIIQEDEGFGAYKKDPLKIVLKYNSLEGKRSFERELENRGIKLEKSTSRTVQFLVTMGTSRDNIESLQRAIRENGDALGEPEEPAFSRSDRIEKGVGSPVRMRPRRAVLEKTETIPIEEAEGRIASQMVTPFPPGIPVIVPGIRVNESMIRLVENAIDEGGLEAVHGIYHRGATTMIDVVSGIPDEQRQDRSLIAEIEKIRTSNHE